MPDSLFTILTGVISALIAAAVSIGTVVYTQYRSKRLAYFQAFFARKLDIYSEFWASVGHYERDRTTANYARLEAALHTVCLLAPLSIYQKALNAANELEKTGQMSGGTVQELLDLMRLDLDQCRKLKFSRIEPIDDELCLEPKK